MELPTEMEEHCACCVQHCKAEHECPVFQGRQLGVVSLTHAGNKQYKSYGPPLTRNGQPQPMQDILGCPTASECELRNFSDCLGREDPALLARQQKEISVLTVRKCVYSSKAKIMLIKLQSNFVY